MISAQIDWLDQAAAQQRLAQLRLAALVERNRQSYEARRYRERRTAALKASRAA